MRKVDFAQHTLQAFTSMSILPRQILLCVVFRFKQIWNFGTCIVQLAIGIHCTLKAVYNITCIYVYVPILATDNFE